MWTPEESNRIQQIAKDIVPDIKTHALPHGLQVQKGPEAVVEYLKEQIPVILSKRGAVLSIDAKYHFRLQLPYPPPQKSQLSGLGLDIFHA